MKALAALLILALASASACAREDDQGDLPPACGATAPEALASALTAAPEPVRFEGTAISDCLVGNAPVGDVQLVGSLLVDAAQRLAAERRRVALGYLVGAVRRGADPGVHAEMVRRVEQEALPFEGSRAFARGERAGRTSG